MKKLITGIIFAVVTISIIVFLLYYYTGVLQGQNVNSIKNSFQSDSNGQQTFATAEILYNSQSALNITYAVNAGFSGYSDINGTPINSEFGLDGNLTFAKYDGFTRNSLSAPLRGIADFLAVAFGRSPNSTVNGNLYSFTFYNGTGLVDCSTAFNLLNISSNASLNCKYTRDENSSFSSALGATGDFNFNSTPLNSNSEQFSFIGNEDYNGQPCSLMKTTNQDVGLNAIKSGNAYLCFSDAAGLPLFFNITESQSQYGLVSENLTISAYSHAGISPTRESITYLPANANWST